MFNNATVKGKPLNRIIEEKRNKKIFEPTETERLIEHLSTK